MNNTPRTLRPLVALATRGLSGAEQLGAVINLLHNVSGSFAQDLYDLAGRAADPAAEPPVEAMQGKQSLYVEARILRMVKSAELQAARQEAYEFLVLAKDSLRKPLGRQWSAAWAAAGFAQGSLKIPRDAVPALGFLAEYLRSNPSRELPAVEFTEAKAEELKATLIAAQAAADMARVNVTAAKQARDLAMKKLRDRVVSLRTELASLLSRDDSRWYAFGFRRPVDGETPDLIEEVILTPAGPGQVLAEWSRSRLAENYRVKWKIAGSSDEPVDGGLGADQQRFLQELPSGQEITVLVTARNASGESAPMTASIVVP